MSDESEDECPACPAGIPAWVMTFADLMSLLMCFFVLLLSFSEMDVLKYKQLAGSMAFAFGVQNKVDLKDIPRGTSIVAQEFSPGRPQPTPLNVVQQETTDITKNTLEVQCDHGEDEIEENDKGDKGESTRSQQSSSTQQSALQNKDETVIATQQDAKRVAVALEDQITSGQLEIETRKRQIIIRVKERGSFPSGSATLRPQFMPVMAKMREALRDITGTFYVEGHSDDIPISTPRFRSNWELSAARAVSVAHELFSDPALDEQRFTVVGYADTKPLVPNADWRSRSKNRRVEIIVEQGEATPPKVEVFDTETIEEEDLNRMIEELESREQPVKFEFGPDEIF